jgi:membrane-bound serine protease (ClpP class)
MIPRAAFHLVALLAALLVGSSLANAAERVVVVRVEGAIGEDTVAMVHRAVELAESQSARHIVLEIDSPGGAVLAMNEIGRALELSPVEAIAYVRGDAGSAAAYVALCGKRIYMRPGSQIGSATPILAIPGLGAVPTEKIDKGLNEKLLSDVRARFRNKASEHDRPGLEAIAEAMVDPDIEVLLVQVATGQGGEPRPMSRTEYDDVVRGGGNARIVTTISAEGKLLNLTAEEAFDYGLSDGFVESREELFEALGVADADVLEVSVSWSERLFGSIGTYAWLLWGIALLLLFIEFKTPGFGLPGALGLGMIALLLTRNHMIGLAELPEILLVIAGVVLLAIEIFVIPGFGIPGILGILCVAAGVVLSFLPFVTPASEYESRLLNDTLRNFLLSVFVAPLGGYLLFHFVLRRLPMYRAIRLEGADAALVTGSAAALSPDHAPISVRTGDHGQAVSVLRPAGKVEIDGKLLDAVSGGEYIESGVRVEVVSVAANHVVVRAVGAADRS